MRKLFRFKYEPCNGTCYAWCDALPEELLKSDEETRQAIVALMVEAHGKLCDNPDFSFGVDRHDSSGMFISHFRTPASTETFLGANFEDAVRQVCAQVLGAEIPQISGSCTFGEHGSEDLGFEILRACKDVAFREAHHSECPCHSKVG